MTTDYQRDRDFITPENPFSVTKATDLSDSAISDTWVDWPAPGGFVERVSIKSPMARVITGGKGAGRTHLMRHYSAPVQVIRGGQNAIEQIRRDGVLGIYAPCSGLNSSRFRNRGQTAERWQGVFGHYMDVWLAQVALGAFEIATRSLPPSEQEERAIAKEVRALFHDTGLGSGASLAGLRDDLHHMQRQIDLAVGLAAVRPGSSLHLPVQPAPGSLVFGVPAALRHHYKALPNVTYLYLIDEFENFEDEHQRYINSLVRERTLGVSFMIGVRTFGFQTPHTLRTGEANKRGAEIEQITLDRGYTRDRQNRIYKDFCRKVVARRLATSSVAADMAVESLWDHLSPFCETTTARQDEQAIVDRESNRERPYLQRLADDLSTSTLNARAPLLEPRDVSFIVDATRVPSRPLLEKANVLLIYRAWKRGGNPIDEAQRIIDTRPPRNSSGVVPPNQDQKRILSHYSRDFRAQLRGHETYTGIDTFIDMSGSSPRNLLVILKNVYRWALFNGERPFAGGRISVEAQQAGVREAADWFFDDAKPLGDDGEGVHDAIHRLGELLRRLRFADKLVECSLSSFSADLTTCSSRTREVVELASRWALLVRVDRGQKERNTGLVEAKFQLNRMLSPRWELPIARRGVLRLGADEMDAIFDPADANAFSDVVRQRLDRMRPPFGRRVNPAQKTLNLDN